MLNDQELEHRTEEEIEQQIEEATQVKSEYGEVQHVERTGSGD